MIRICIAMMLLSCVNAADAVREQALGAILQELDSVRQDHLARADKIGDKALAIKITQLNEQLAREWQAAVKDGNLAPDSSLTKWRNILQESLVAMRAKKKDKVAAGLQEKLDYIEWLLGKPDPRFDGGQRVLMY